MSCKATGNIESHSSSQIIYSWIPHSSASFPLLIYPREHLESQPDADLGTPSGLSGCMFFDHSKAPKTLVFPKLLIAPIPVVVPVTLRPRAAKFAKEIRNGKEHLYIIMCKAPDPDIWILLPQEILGREKHHSIKTSNIIQSGVTVL